MVLRRVLLFDSDETFATLLRESLEPYAVEIETIGDISTVTNEALEVILEENLLFSVVASDLPDREGFRLLGRIRIVDRRHPVAIVTSTLDLTELKLHSNLRIHADAYLDKRTLTVARLVLALSVLAPEAIALPPDEVPHLSRTPDLATSVTNNPIEDGPLVLDALFPTADDLDDDDPSAMVVRLRGEIAKLEAELAQSRGEARSSPFSDEYRKARELAERQAAELSHLRLVVAQHETETAALQANISELERSNETIQETESCIRGEHALELKALREGHESEKQALRKELKSALDAANTEIHEAAQRAEQLQRSQLNEISRAVQAEHEMLVRTHVEALESTKCEVEEALTAAVEKVRSEESGQRMRLTSEHKSAMARLEQSYAENIAAVRDETAHEIERISREAEDLRFEEVAAAEVDGARRVADAQEAAANEFGAQLAQHESKWAAKLAEQAREAEDTLERREAEWQRSASKTFEAQLAQHESKWAAKLAEQARKAEDTLEQREAEWQRGASETFEVQLAQHESKWAARLAEQVREAEVSLQRGKAEWKRTATKKFEARLEEIESSSKLTHSRQSERIRRDSAAQQDCLERAAGQARRDMEAAVAEVRIEYDAVKRELERSESKLKSIHENVLYRDAALAEKEIELGRMRESFQALQDLFVDLSAVLETSHSSDTMDIAVQSLLRSILDRFDTP